MVLCWGEEAEGWEGEKPPSVHFYLPTAGQTLGKMVRSDTSYFSKSSESKS